MLHFENYYLVIHIEGYKHCVSKLMNNGLKVLASIIHSLIVYKIFPFKIIWEVHQCCIWSFNKLLLPWLTSNYVLFVFDLLFDFYLTTAGRNIKNLILSNIKYFEAHSSLSFPTHRNSYKHVEVRIILLNLGQLILFVWMSNSCKCLRVAIDPWSWKTWYSTNIGW